MIKESTKRGVEGLSMIEQAISPFRLGALQDCVTIHRHLERHGFCPEQLEAYLKSRIDRMKIAARHDGAQRAGGKIWEKYGPKCPDCKTVLTLRAGDDNDSHLTCYKCRWGGYDPRPAQTVWNEVIRKVEEMKNG